MGKNKEIYLTEQGLQELKDEYDHLINVDRPNNINAIKDARAMGDLSENADYDAARQEQAKIEARIKEIEYMLEHYTIITDVKGDKVQIGSTVKIEYLDEDDEEEYTIVGVQEADPFSFKISNESPIAQAILSKKVGDVVTVESPNGTYSIKITEIK